MKGLFDEVKISSLKVKNRFIRSATWEELADEKGHLTKELINLYEELAKNNIGTIITSYAFVNKDEQPAAKMLGIYEDSFIQEYKELTDIVHKYNTKIILQMAYGGSQSGFNIGERIIWGPSAVENISSKVTPVEMTKDDIKTLVKQFGEASIRAKKSGFDGVQIHGAHGYLLSQFLTPYYNKRIDEYGGSIENRGRIIFEIYNEVRKQVGKEFSVWIKLNCEDFMNEGNLTFEESKYICKRLDEMGINAIEISGGSGSSKRNKGPLRIGIKSKDKEAYFKKQADEIAREIKTPVILVGGNRSLEVIEDLLNNSNLELFSLSRPLLCEPNLISRWKNGDKTESKCMSCNRCHNVEGKTCILNMEDKL